jgi:hypothetical protein
MLMNGSNFQWEDFVEPTGAVIYRHYRLNRVCQIAVSILGTMYKSATNPRT